MDLQGGFNDFRVLVGEAGHIGVRLAHLYHHGAEHVWLGDLLVGFWQDHTLAGAQFVEGFDIFIEALEVVGVDDGAVQVERHILDHFADNLGTADQDGDTDAFILDLGGGTDDLGFFAFSESDALLGFGGLSLVGDEIADACALALAEGQLFAILVDIDGLAGDAGLHGGFGYCGGFPQHDPHVKRLGDDVVDPELEAVDAVCAQHVIGDIFAGEVEERLGGGEFHFFVDGTGAHIQGAAEDERKTKHVVDLVGAVRTAGGDDDVRAGFLGQFILDFGIGVCHGTNEGAVGHGADHVGGQDIGDGQAIEDICAAHGLSQGALVGIDGKGFLVLVHAFGAALVYDAFAVEHQDVLALHAPAHGQVGAGNGGSTGSGDDHFYISVLLADDFERICQGRRRDDGGTVLIIMEDRDIQHTFEGFLDVEALGGFDIFQVDAPEGGGDGFCHHNDFIWIVGVHFDIEDIHICESFEKDALALHDGFAGQGAAVAQAQDGSTVGQDRHQVAFGSVLVGGFRILFDIQHRHGHTGSIGQAQVALGVHRLGRDDGDLARFPIQMVIFPGFLICDFRHITSI